MTRICTHAETLVLEVVTTIVERYSKKLTPEALQASLGAHRAHSCPSRLIVPGGNAVLQASSGRRPLEAWQAVADLLGIDRSAQQLFDESEPLLEHRSAPNLSGWRCSIKARQQWHHGRACSSHCHAHVPSTQQHHALQLSAKTHTHSLSHIQTSHS